MQQGVANENELLNHFIELMRWSGFSKVNQISTVKLSPDIDFLQIDTHLKETIGYEFKLIKYNKAWKKANLMPMYTGLGEAFHYFQFGVDKSYLVLGMSNNIPLDALDEALKRVRQLAQTFISLQALYKSDVVIKFDVGLRCFGVYIWNERTNDFTLLLKATENFPMTGDNKHLKLCLLRREFKFDKEF